MTARTNLVLPWRVEKCVGELEVESVTSSGAGVHILWGTGPP